MTRDKLKKARDALIANHNTEHMTALLKETNEISRHPTPTCPIRRENASLPNGAIGIRPRDDGSECPGRQKGKDHPVMVRQRLRRPPEGTGGLTA